MRCDSILGFKKTEGDEQQPRICWVPTDSLYFLPIHAAGHHSGDFSRTVLERVTSSYSPSVKALLYALRNKERAYKAQKGDKFVLASMETTPGLSRPCFSKREIEELEQILASVSPISLERPTRAQVLDELSSCKVFHFAGYESSHPTDPSMSSLVVTDWKETPLTVKDLVAKKLHQNPPFLAHLSACSTAKNQAEVLQDEGLHLMTACQLAGFQHVIGSLWAVSDSHCVDVATDVYKGIGISILQAGMSDESVARRLHSAPL
jgi:CHAT domain-containing protein